MLVSTFGRVVVVLLLTFGLGCGAPTASSPPQTPAEPGGDDSETVFGDCSGKPRVVVQDGHSKIVTDVALSQDGRVLATASADSTVALWDTSSGLLLKRIRADAPVEQIALSAGGDVVVYRFVEGAKGRVVSVDVSGRKPVQRFDGYFYFALSPDGTTLALRGKEGVELVAAKSGTRLTSLPAPKGSAVAFDPAGQRIAISTGPDVVVAEARTGKELSRVAHGFSAPLGLGGKMIPTPPTRLAFDGDALVLNFITQLAVADLKTGSVKKLDLQQVQAMAVGGGRLVAAAMGKPLQVFELPRGTLAEEHAIADLGIVKALTLSGDGALLAVASMNPRDVHRNVVRLRDGRSFAPVRSIEGVTTGIYSLAVSPDGKQLVTGATSGIVTRWDLREGELYGVLPESQYAFAIVAINPSGSRVVVASAGGGLRVFDERFKPLSRRDDLRALRSVHFLDDRKLVVTDARGLWTVDIEAPQQPPAELGERFPSGATALSPDRRQIATFRAYQVKLVEAGSGRELWATSAVDRGTSYNHFAFTDDGTRLLFSSLEQRTPQGRIQEVPSIRVYDRKTGKLLDTYDVGTVGPMVPYGKQILIGGRAPALVDLDSGRVIKRLEMPDAAITAMQKHPRLAGFALLGGDGGSTSLVSLETGQVRAILRATSNGEYVTATPEGYYRASLDGARAVAWRFDCPLEAFPFSQYAARFDRPAMVRKVLGGKPAAAGAAIERPPLVRLDAPPGSTKQSSVSIPVSVWSPTKVQAVRAFVNGRAAGQAEVGKAHAKLSLAVPLVPGRNRVSVVAYDEAGIASNPRAVDVQSTGSATTRPELWVVAVGVSRYPGLSKALQLEVADDDARSIAQAFASQTGGNKAYAKAHVTTLIDGQATVESITNAVEGLSAMKPDDLGVLFMAGHGVKLKDGKSVFLTGKATLKAADARRHSVGWSRLNQALAKVRGRVVVLLDACHSGHLSTDQVAPNEKLAQELSEGRRASMVVFAAARGRQLSSSRGLELAWGDQKPPPQPPSATGHGLFTAALLEALGGKATDIDQSGAIESSEVIAYVTDRVRGLSNGMQTPWLVRQEMFGDFALSQP